MLSKRTSAAIILSVILIISFSQFSFGYSMETPTESPADTSNVLTFLRDVIQLDLTKYEATLLTTFLNYWFGGVVQTSGDYSLNSLNPDEHSILTVRFTFWETQLTSCSIHEDSQGPPLYVQPPATDLGEAAAGFLQRYQTYSGDAELAKMRSILDTTDTTVNVTRTVDNVKLEVKIETHQTLFTWTNSVNGADFSRLRLEFRDGYFNHFYDDRGFYKIGSAEVNISEEDAIRIALEDLDNRAYKFSNGMTINSSNVVKTPIRTQMNVMGKTNDLEKYPIWIVTLPLDRLYPGFVSYIDVSLWADTGEVIKSLVLGSGGALPGGPTTTPEGSTTTPEGSTTEPALTNDETNDKTEQPTANQPFAIYTIAAAVAISIPIAIAALVHKRRSKKQSPNISLAASSAVHDKKPFSDPSES